jgi:CBS domain-containing protein
MRGHATYAPPPKTTVGEVARLLAARRISGTPVVDPQSHVVGIVTEGDLLRRYDIGTDQRHRSWLERLMTLPDDLASEFVKTHARLVADIMTRDVISVGDTDSVASIRDLRGAAHQARRWCGRRALRRDHLPITRSARVMAEKATRSGNAVRQ